MKFTTILYAVPFALVAGQFQQAPALERIATLSYSGDGCPSNATTGGSVKGKRWTSSFSGFVAQSGPVTPIQARERSCSVSLTGKLPDGWSIAPSSLTPHYSFNLDTDVDFFLTNAANFGGQRSRWVRKSLKATGPGASKDSKTLDFKGYGLSSPCGGEFNLTIHSIATLGKSEEALNGTKYSKGSVDSIEYTIDLTTCTNTTRPGTVVRRNGWLGGLLVQ